MLVTGLTSIVEDDATIGGEAKFYDDLFVVGHRRLTGTVHDEDAKIVLQTAMVNTSRPNIRAGVNEGSFLPAAIALAESVTTPVVLVGGLRSLETVNHILAQTPIEYIALSRPLIREPNLINRWRSGDHRPSSCVSCNACYRTHAHSCIFAARL